VMHVYGDIITHVISEINMYLIPECVLMNEIPYMTFRYIK
jgi:hypothetical protein